MHFRKYICIILSEDLNNVFIGTYPYGNGGQLPLNKSELRGFDGLCAKHYHRRGQLCGACEENYTLSVYSYYLGCVKCEDYKYGWVKFIAAAFFINTLLHFDYSLLNISYSIFSK